MTDALVTIVLHYSGKPNTDDTTYLKTVQSIFNQTHKQLELIILHDGIDAGLLERIESGNTESAPVHFLEKPGETPGARRGD